VALAREAAEKAEHVGLLSEIFAFEAFILAMMAKHDEARARVDCSLQLALNNIFLCKPRGPIAYCGPSDFKADYAGAATRNCTRSLSADNKAA